MNKKYIQVTIISIVGILLICGCTQTSKNTKDSQKGSELEAVDTLHILQVGEKAVDAELFDMQGNKHRLFEAFADNRYVLFDFWNLHCGACRKAESELLEVYDRMKGRLEIVAINLDSISEWQAHEWSKKIVWKNWNDGKKFKKGGIKSHYYDFNACTLLCLIVARWSYPLGDDRLCRRIFPWDDRGFEWSQARQFCESKSCHQEN